MVVFCTFVCSTMVYMIFGFSMLLNLLHKEGIMEDNSTRGHHVPKNLQ
jgi:hypothetical protein